MAGDWIKLQHATPDKPEIHSMSNALGVTPEHVLGCIVRVWIWADQQTITGNAQGVTDVTLDRIACNAGFAQAMRNVGWLDANGFPNFHRHNGETAKKRALTNKRVKKLRNAESVTREEKKREDSEAIGVGSSEDVLTLTPSGSNNTVGKKRVRPDRNYVSEAVELLDFLNDKTGHNFEPVKANLDLIVPRLKEGATVEDCKSLIAMKVREWTGTDKATYLRPSTLFAARNFAQYKGQLAQAPVGGGE